MAKHLTLCITAILVLLAFCLSAPAIQEDKERLDQLQTELKEDVPHLVCLDNNIATGGQPTENA
jgi:hypothetical protein